jgi:TPR repeat protein
MRLVAALACAVMLICLGVLPSQAEKRVALVIGNDRYANLPADEQLRKAVNDARAVGDALASLGFEVIRGDNLGRQAMVDKFDELTQRLAAGDTAFFFFSGHGVAIGGGNYILPTDVPNIAIGQDTRLARAALGETDIVSDLQGRGVRVAVVVLDACRNNPFKRPGSKGVGAERGLGRIEPVQGVFTFYSAGIGQTALDRLNDADDNPNSVFTRVFIPALTRPGLALGDLAVEVREEVARVAASVHHNQRPAYYDETIGGRVYLAGLPKEGETGLSIARPPGIPSEVERGLAEAREAAVRECDRLAASPDDATRPGGIDGVAFKDISAAQAVPTCRAALAVRPNDARVALQLGRALQKKGGADAQAEAMRWYRNAAEAGNQVAMASLGDVYAYGWGVTKDEAEALRWYRKSAEGGSASAMANLGHKLQYGWGITKDETEAVRWFRKAADAGFPGAMISMGNMYRDGKGITKDEAEAVRWYRSAADTGDATGLFMMARVYLDGRGVTKDETQAASWFRKAAGAGSAGAMGYLADMYRDGKGVAKDDAEAVRWYRKAVDAGGTAAMTMLGEMYREGRGVNKDGAEAVRWYRKAAEAGDPTGMNNLGMSYANGLGGTRDLAEAARWLQKAVDAGNEGAKANLKKLGR